MNRRRMILLAVCSLLILGADSELVRKHVETGVQKYRRGEFAAAAKAFHDADLLQPGVPIIEFNRGCAEAKAQNRDGAKVLLRAATLADDTGLAASAHYNLGCIEALAARGIFEVAAREVSKADRKRGLARLTKAIQHYRDCLAIDPKHEDARRNIEIIRLWTANIKREWALLDQQKDEQQAQSPEEISLPVFLDRLDHRQHTALDARIHETHGIGFDPTVLMDTQRGIGDAVPDLRTKIDQHFAMPDDAPAEQVQAVAEVADSLRAKADQIAEDSAVALKELPAGDLDVCLDAQGRALDHINSMYETVVAFPQLVTRALRLQDLTQTRNQLLVNDRRRRQLTSATISGGNFLSERQSRVAALMELLTERAEAFRSAIEQGPASQADEDVIKGMQTAIDRALEYSPRLVELTSDATQLLADDQYREALPPQREAVELLKRIAETLPRQNSGSDDEENKSGDDEDTDPEQVGEDELGDSDDEEKKKPQQGRKEQEQQRQREREAAEALLRRVRDREQNLRELKAQLRAMRAQRSTAERDW